jgi:hypothetical protein
MSRCRPMVAPVAASLFEKPEKRVELGGDATQ